MEVNSLHLTFLGSAESFLEVFLLQNMFTAGQKGDDDDSLLYMWWRFSSLFLYFKKIDLL